jgi:glycosyltransferase involved in cell wall biosynthesis
MLSIVIPTRAAGRALRTVRSLAGQDIGDEPVEVVVVVDGVASGTSEWFRDMPFPLKVVRQRHRGQAAARNRGAAEASGDWLLFLDDDMEFSAGFLRQIMCHVQAGADVVLPDLRIGPWVPDTLPVRIARRLELEEREARWSGAPIVFEDMVFAATAIRRTRFEAARGFDEAFTADGAYGNEDIELGYRLLGDGANVRRAFDAVAHTDFPHTVPRLVRRARQVGRNDVRLARMHPALAEPLFGRKLVHSRIHRLVGTIALRTPWLFHGEALLRWPIQRSLHDRTWDGKLPSRLWLALRSVWYWRGVVEADGKVSALTGAAAVRGRLRSEGRRHSGRLRILHVHHLGR